jgi:hypothetical protein
MAFEIVPPPAPVGRVAPRKFNGFLNQPCHPATRHDADCRALDTAGRAFCVCLAGNVTASDFRVMIDL